MRPPGRIPSPLLAPVRSFRPASMKSPSCQTCALGTLPPYAGWAYSWLSCPSFRPPRAGWSWAGRSAATGWRTRCCPSGSRCRSSPPTRCRRSPTRPRRSSWCSRWRAWRAYSMAPWIGLAVAAVMLVVIASYRQNVHAYPVRRRRLRGGHHQPGPHGRADGGQRAAGGLRAHRRGVDGVGDVEHRVGGAVHRAAQGVFAVAAILVLASLNLRGIRESGTAFAIPDLRVHDRHVHHARLGAVPDLRARRPAARRVGGLRAARRARRRPRVRAWCSWWPGRSRRAARR